LKRSRCTHLLAILFLMATYVVSAVLSMAAGKPLMLRLSASPWLLLLLDLLIVSMILLFSLTLPPMVVPLFFSIWMICSSWGMIMSILSLLRLISVSNFICLTWALLVTFLG
jgi:hypothetical protein